MSENVDEVRLATWLVALNTLALERSEARGVPVRIAREMLVQMHRSPVRFARPMPLPDAFGGLLQAHGIDNLEKAAGILGRMNAAQVRVPKARIKPMLIALAVVPEAPLKV